MAGFSAHRLRYLILFAVILGLALALLPRTASFGQGDPGTPPPADADGWRTYPDTHPWLAYSGDWQTFPVTAAAGGALTASDDPAASLIVRFQGSGIRVLYARGPEGGTFTGQVDWLMTQGDSQAGSYSYGHVLVFPGLAPGEHTFTLTNSSGAVWIEAVQVQGTLLEPVSLPTVTPAPDQDATWTTYQDTDPRLVYGGGTWQTFPVANANGGTLTGTADPGATVTLQFAGTAVRILYSHGPEGRSFTARIDGWLEQTANAASDTYSYGHELTFQNIPKGTHALTVMNGDGAIWVEAIQIQGILLSITSKTETSPVQAALTPASPLPADSPRTLASVVEIPPGDTSAFLAALSDGSTVINLSSGAVYETDETLYIPQNKVIHGHNATFQATALVTVFNVNAETTVEIHDLTVKNGMANYGGYGGAIFNQGDLSIFDSVIEINGTPEGAQGGGGIENTGTLTLTRTTVRINAAGGGGGIQNDGLLTAECARFYSNQANYGGALLNTIGARATIRYSSFVGPNGEPNQSLIWGGGAIYNLDTSYSVDAQYNYWGGGAPQITPGLPSANTVWGVSFLNYLTSDPTIEGNPEYDQHCTRANPNVIIQVISDRNGYLSPVDARTERIQYPERPAQQPDQVHIGAVFSANMELCITRYFRYPMDADRFITDEYIVQVNASRSPSFPRYGVVAPCSDTEAWQTLYTEQPLWISIQDIITGPVVTFVVGTVDVLSGEFTSLTDFEQRIETIRSYGAEIRPYNQYWTDIPTTFSNGAPVTLRVWDDTPGTNEIESVRNAVVNTASAFSILSANSALPEESFQQIMGISNPDTNHLLFIRTDGMSPQGTTGHCQAVPGGSPNTLVYCYGNIAIPDGAGSHLPGWVTEYALVHELGHVFNYQSGLGGIKELKEYIHDTSIDSNAFITDNREGQKTWVMANVYILTTGELEWRRGERGWGSGPGSTYSTATILLSESYTYNGPDDKEGKALYQRITDFQQHPAPFTGDWDDETAADMFLNWVYRANNIGGFLNVTWKPRDITHSQVCNLVAGGCDEATHKDHTGKLTNGSSGDARFEWMNKVMQVIFYHHRTHQWPQNPAWSTMPPLWP